MVKKEFNYKGKTIAELKKMSLSEFAQIVPARQRRGLKRGFNDKQKLLLKRIRRGDKNIETHCRDMVIIPEMVEMTLKIHNGKIFEPVTITAEMLGHYLGEFVMTRKRVAHSAPGIGATKSSAALSVK